MVKLISFCSTGKFDYDIYNRIISIHNEVVSQEKETFAGTDERLKLCLAACLIRYNIKMQVLFMQFLN